MIFNSKLLCEGCISKFGTCATCVKNRGCAFHQNPAPIPKFVMQKTRQETDMGYIEQIQQVVNPQRAKAFCVEGECGCCELGEDGKYRCLRQFGVCGSYEEMEI